MSSLGPFSRTALRVLAGLLSVAGLLAGRALVTGAAKSATGAFASLVVMAAAFVGLFVVLTELANRSPDA